MSPALASSLISSALQVGVVLVICAIAYLFVRRKTSFWRFLGLAPASTGALVLGALIGAAGALLLVATPSVRAVAGAQGTVVGDATAHGVTTEVLVGLFVAAVFKTAFAEELLFRGLIAKRLIGWMGFAAGNTLQALIFGAVHLPLLFLGRVDPLIAGALCGFVTLLGWFNGWLNETRAGGSILPGWAAHAAANLVTYLSMALVWPAA